MDSTHSTRTQDWNLVKELFADALDLHVDEREEWLNRRCRNNAWLRAEVDALLLSHDQAESSDYLSTAAINRPPDPFESTLDVGSTVGPWHLDAVIGQGGMGRVFKAHRVDGAYDRVVAIKLLRPDRGAEETRFRSESQILARLEHPNIARLYDAGVVSGVPYLAMAFVDGDPITKYAEKQGLNVDERIKLFLQVADATAFAHRNLVVHRDLKPSNILVGEGGNVSLLDFGIARIVGEDGIEVTQTASSGLALTLAYAAPEQVRRQPITTSTDIYSLGLVLFELLSGRRAYSIADKSLTEIDRIVCETDPEPLDAHGQPFGSLSGDLTTIVMKAIAKAPEDRYPSVTALASDLRRYLGGLPVEARRPTPAYRFSKFVKRNRKAVIAAGTILLALLTGFSVAVWQARVAAAERDLAEHRFQAAREMAGESMFDIHDAIVEVPGATGVRQLIVTRSLSYLERLAKDAGNDAYLRLDLANAYLRTGNVQGNPNNANLGRLEDALASYNRGLAVLPGDATADSLIQRVLRSRAVLNEKRAEVFAALGLADSVTAAIGTANRFLNQLATEYPNEATVLRDLAINNVKSGDLLGNPNFPNIGNTRGALDRYRLALAILDRAQHFAKPGEEFLRERGVIHERLGVIYWELGQANDAVANYQRSFEIRKSLYEKYPNHLNIYRDLGVAHEKLALIHQARNDLAASRTEFESALEVFQSLAATDPDNVQAQRSLAIEYLHMAELKYSRNLPNEGDKRASRTWARKALEILDADPNANSDDTRLRSLVEWAERIVSQ